MEEDWDREDFQNDYHKSENGKDDCYDWDEEKFDDNILRKPNQKDTWRKRYTLERDDNKNFIMTVSSNRIGQIIGKQGVKIKELEQNSGAKIIVCF